VGIFTIMTIAVRERTSEIGLLQAVGAHRRQIRNMFLGESMILAAIGGFAGLALGFAIIGVLSLLVPALPVSPSWPYLLAALLVAMLIGLIAGVLPAWRAAQLDPVESLRAE
jgi:putative ABC transport system permease protein